MNRRLIKPILFGLLLGTGLFFAPYLVLQTLFIFFLIGFIFMMFGGRKRRRMHLAYADRIRSMSDEEYETFKSSRGHGCC